MTAGHLYPASLDGTPAVPCRDCGFLVLWGLTKNGKPAPFNERPPHLLHAVTCEARKAARKALKKRKKTLDQMADYATHPERYLPKLSKEVTDLEAAELDRRIRRALREG